MITKQDAIKLGKAITKVAAEASKPKLLPITQTPAPETQQEAAMRHCVRGTCIYALDNVWYDVLPVRTREQFGNNRDNFYKACDWPE